MPVELSPEAKGSATTRARLAHRRLIVVGAGTRASDEPDPPVGNGRAIAVLAAREGAAVACVDAGGGGAAEAGAGVERDGGRAFSLVADVSDAAACERVVAEASERLGGLDGVVLNVGIAAGRKLEGTSPELWDQTFAVNLRAHFLLARAALPRLADGGAI